MKDIKLTYYYSACIKTETDDVTVLHDPWFSDGIYDGSWFQFPKMEDPINDIGDSDLIFVSHIHPDHYDPVFLKNYFKKYGEKKIIISDHQPNFLYGKMKADGFNPEIIKDTLQIGNTSLNLISHYTGSISDIDCGIVIHYKDSDKVHCVVNTNDIVFDSDILSEIKSIAGKIDILACGYTGAGPYPQTYYDIDDPNLIEEAEKKKLDFFQRYNEATSFLDAKINIPFAGKYLLGGNLSSLNDYRGVADPVEILAIDSNAIVLSDHGGSISTSDLKPSKTRKDIYDKNKISQRINQIKDKKMAYEKLFDKSEIDQLPIKRLLSKASMNALAKSEVEEDYYFVIRLNNNESAVINAKKGNERFFKIQDQNAELPLPRSEIDIDPRYLFGLLTHIYHWNNAEVGSQFFVKRTPNKFDRGVQSFLNFLTI